MLAACQVSKLYKSRGCNFRRQEMVNSTVPGVAASLVRRKPGKLLRCVHCQAPRRTYSLCKTWNLKTLAMTAILLIVSGYNVEEVQILWFFPAILHVRCLLYPVFDGCLPIVNCSGIDERMVDTCSTSVFRHSHYGPLASQPAPHNVVNVPTKKYSKALSSFPW